jgi:hypothetical protein
MKRVCWLSIVRYCARLSATRATELSTENTCPQFNQANEKDHQTDLMSSVWPFLFHSRIPLPVNSALAIVRFNVTFPSTVKTNLLFLPSLVQLREVGGRNWSSEAHTPAKISFLANSGAHQGAWNVWSKPLSESTDPGIMGEHNPLRLNMSTFDPRNNNV